MKLLVAYDGSERSESALDDLPRAGLPETCDVTVVTVGEVWLPRSNSEPRDSMERPKWVCPAIREHYGKHKKIVAEATILAKHARDRMQKMFPGWRVESEGTYGSPAWEILTKAEEIRPDLIVVGSHGRASISRFFLGSISQKVLTEAECSVRVARGRIEVDPTPVRIVIGFDGSKGAQAAVESVADRNLPRDSEIRLVCVVEDLTPLSIGRFVPPGVHTVGKVNVSEREWIERLADSSIKALRSKGVSATLHVQAGNPKDVLVEAAQQWNADCVFLGANAFGSRVERFLLGSTSAAVAARSQCSVEIVRSQDRDTSVPK